MNAVLGAIKNLSFNAIAPFLRSLQNSGFEGRLIFFAADADEATLERLRREGVEIVEASGSDIEQAIPVNSLRYFVYESILNQIGGAVSNVMLADVRDIVFQRDPFDFDMEGRLCCFLEAECATLGSSFINAGWVAAAYGKEVLEKMAHFPVSCSGTTMGPLTRVREYVQTMTKELNAAAERVPFIMHVIPGIDQAVHNYLLHTGSFGEVNVLSNEHGPIWTMNYVSDDSVRFSERGLLVNEDAVEFNVLHQYDRRPQLAARVFRSLGFARDGTGAAD